ncbi:hypothetical protein CYMTET_53168 [Cymbomonas tetramitiformis]|uniref:Uncharacterized protein n=1 Tax=Cymbomonas tetramitiformis TaxID=36881 RepID=A0AAE0EQB4_9CHLO|nr:hypothetical protein CYMTET_53168 [Cymbomonas tetramitiformis]
MGGKSKAELKIWAKDNNIRVNQFTSAIAYCFVHMCGAKAAVSTGQWPLVTASALHDRLKGKIRNGASYELSRALTDLEEASLSRYFILKNFGGEGEGREHMDNVVVSVLKARQLLNRKGGRLRIPLSLAAQEILHNGRPGSKTVFENQIPVMKGNTDVLISTQANAFQDNHTLLKALQHLDKQLVRRGVKKPVMWLTDGQSARFNLKVLDFAEENGLEEFVYPPHTTTAHALLDRVFHMWHTTYSKCVEDWSEANPGKQVTKAVFAAVFPDAWLKWTRGIRVHAVASKVGISEDGIFPDRIADSFFVKSNLQNELTKVIKAMDEKSVLPPFTPEPSTFATRTQKLEEENKMLREELLRLRAQPLSPEEIGLCTIKSDKQIPEVGTSRKKATQEMFAACAQELESIEQEMTAPQRAAAAAAKEAEKLRKEAEKQAERVRKEVEKAEREAEKVRKDAEKAAEKARRDAEKEAAKAQKALERESKKRERERVAQEKKTEAEARKHARISNRASAQGTTASGFAGALGDITNMV